LRQPGSRRILANEERLVPRLAYPNPGLTLAFLKVVCPYNP
jgi:hypothetical protein